MTANHLSSPPPLNLTNEKYQSQYSAKVYPNGEFTVGYVPKRKNEENPPSRFISSPKSEQVKKVYGTNGITSYGRRSLRNGVYLLKRRYTNKNLGFYTATLPSVSIPFLKKLIANWKDITHRFFQELRREAERLGIEDFDYVYAIEIQEKRSRSAGLPIPHIHWVAPAFMLNSRKFIFSANKIRDIWARTVSHYIGTGFNYEASIDSRLIKKDVERYLSKYISKSSTKNVQDFSNASGIVFASRYWGISKRLQELYLSKIVFDSDKIAKNLVMISSLCLKEAYEYMFEIMVSITPEVELRMGYVGRLTKLGESLIYS